MSNPTITTTGMFDPTSANMPADHIAVYHRSIAYFLDTHVNANILSLPESDRRRFYQMVTDYADLWIKLFERDGGPLFEYVYYGDEHYSIKLNNPTSADLTYECPLVAEYKAMGFPTPVPRSK